MILLPLALFILPTTINFAISYLLAKRLANGHLKQVPIFLCASIILALNVRIPGMISDGIFELSNKPGLKINKVIEIYEGNTVAIQATADKVETKLEYFKAVDLQGNEGCMCVYFVHPLIEKDDFIKWLKGRGLEVEQGKHSESPVRIVADVNQNDAHSSVNVLVYLENNEVAEYHNRFRRSFPFEHSENTFVNTLIAFSQNTIWSGAFSKENPLPHPVSQFLSQAIKVKETPITLKTQHLNVVSELKVPSDILMPQAPPWHKPETCSGRISFDKRWHGDDISKPFREFVQKGAPGQEDIPMVMRGREVGTNVLIVGQDVSEKHVFMKTQEITNYVEAIPLKVICREKDFVVLAHFIGVGGDPRRLKEKEENLTFWILKYTFTGELVEAETFKILPADKGKVLFKDFEVVTPDRYALYLSSGEWSRIDESNPEGKQFRLLGEHTVTIQKKQK